MEYKQIQELIKTINKSNISELSIEEKDFKILGETIYKSDALSKKFGLFANTSILTLEEIKESDGNPIKDYKTLFERANISKVNIISKQDLESGKTFKELLKVY